MIDTRSPPGHGKMPGYPGRRDMAQVESPTARLRHSPQTNKRLLAAVSQRLEKLANTPESARRNTGRRDFLHPLSQGETRSQTRSPSPGHSPRFRLGSFGSDHGRSPAGARSPCYRQGSDLDLRTSPSPAVTPGQHSPGHLTPGHHSPSRKHGSDHDLHGLRSPCRSPRHRHGRRGARLHLPAQPMLKRIDELRRGSLTGSLPDLREAGTLDHLEGVFRDALVGSLVVPVPPLPQGSDAFREVMLGMRPREEDSDAEDAPSTVRENCRQRQAPVSKYTNNHGHRRPGTLPGIATRNTPTSPRHGKRLSSPAKSTPASPTRLAASPTAFPRFHGGQQLSPIQHFDHRHRHSSK